MVWYHFLPPYSTHWYGIPNGSVSLEGSIEVLGVEAGALGLLSTGKERGTIDKHFSLSSIITTPTSLHN